MRLSLIALAVVLIAASSAHAQVFASGAAFGDIKRFSGDPSNSTLDGTAFGGGARVGMFVAPRWSVEVGIDIGAKTTKTRSLSIPRLTPPISADLAALGLTSSFPIGILPPVFSFQSRYTNRLVATSVMLGFRPATTGRVHPEFLGGLTFVHFARTVDTSGPTPLDSRVVWTGATTSLSPVSYIVAPAPVVRPQKVVDNVPAAAVGFNLALDLTRHLALVPEVRAHAFSLNSGGPSAFVLRPGLALRWIF
jgi:hypothetical protein